MKKAYVNVRNLLEIADFKNFQLFDRSVALPISPLVLDDSNPNLDQYIVGSHPAYEAINHGGRVVLPHRTKTFPSELDGGKKFTTGAYSKSTRTKILEDGSSEKRIEHRVRCNSIFNTLSTGKFGQFQSSLNVIKHGINLRYLTPLECERLMSWPDNWTKFGRNAKGEVYEMSEISRYHLCGNGIVSAVPREIMSHITEEVRVFSTFSGADGSCLGLPKNFKTVAFCEFDEIPSDILRFHYPKTPNYGDITKINIKSVPDFNLLFISAPCQAFSKAGLRKGFEDARGTLFFEAAKIMKERRPKYVLFENVKDLVNHDEGRTLEVILRTFVELGYGGKIDVLDASRFGVPQARERVFILAERL